MSKSWMFLLVVKRLVNQLQLFKNYHSSQSVFIKVFIKISPSKNVFIFSFFFFFFFFEKHFFDFFFLFIFQKKIFFDFIFPSLFLIFFFNFIQLFIFFFNCQNSCLKKYISQNTFSNLLPQKYISKIAPSKKMHFQDWSSEKHILKKYCLKIAPLKKKYISKIAISNNKNKSSKCIFKIAGLKNTF